MTRIPPDMETAMSDEIKGDVTPEVKAAQNDFHFAWNRFNETKEAREIPFRCYAACAAINPENPVVVAEALPELVEAAKGIQDYFDDVDAAVARGEKVYVGRDYPDMQSREVFKRALAKLKARP